MSSGTTDERVIKMFEDIHLDTRFPDLLYDWVGERRYAIRLTPSVDFASSCAFIPVLQLTEVSQYQSSCLMPQQTWGKNINFPVRADACKGFSWVMTFKVKSQVSP
jgi:hypothetical protein